MTTRKYPKGNVETGDAAYQIGEEAFNAGFAAGVAALDELVGLGVGSQSDQGKSLLAAKAHAAWIEFEPSEDVKGLIG